jgi:hypothetical protein
VSQVLGKIKEVMTREWDVIPRSTKLIVGERLCANEVEIVKFYKDYSQTWSSKFCKWPHSQPLEFQTQLGGDRGDKDSSLRLGGTMSSTCGFPKVLGFIFVMDMSI